MTSLHANVASLLAAWSAAIRRKNIDDLLELYAPDIVYFDVTPALRLLGLDAVRANFERWFDIWDGPIGVELKDLAVSQSGTLAAAHMLHRTSGRLKAGREVDYWLRVSVSCERLQAGWAIAHEHVSAPVDFARGVVVKDAEP